MAAESRRVWDDDEQERLLEAVKKHGKKWGNVSRTLGGKRSFHACRSQFTALTKRNKNPNVLGDIRQLLEMRRNEILIMADMGKAPKDIPSQLDEVNGRRPSEKMIRNFLDNQRRQQRKREKKRTQQTLGPEQIRPGTAGDRCFESRPTTEARGAGECNDPSSVSAQVGPRFKNVPPQGHQITTGGGSMASPVRTNDPSSFSGIRNCWDISGQEEFSREGSYSGTFSEEDYIPDLFDAHEQEEEQERLEPVHSLRPRLIKDNFMWQDFSKLQEDRVYEEQLKEDIRAFSSFNAWKLPSNETVCTCVTVGVQIPGEIIHEEGCCFYIPPEQRNEGQLYIPMPPQISNQSGETKDLSGLNQREIEPIQRTPSECFGIESSDQQEQSSLLAQNSLTENNSENNMRN